MLKQALRVLTAICFRNLVNVKTSPARADRDMFS